MSRATTRDDATRTIEWRNFLEATSNAILPCANGTEWTSDSTLDQERAAQLCNSCSALIACRKYAIAVDERHGVLGGLTAADRKRDRRRRTNAA